MSQSFKYVRLVVALLSLANIVYVRGYTFEDPNSNCHSVSDESEQCAERGNFELAADYGTMSAEVCWGGEGCDPSNCWCEKTWHVHPTNCDSAPGVITLTIDGLKGYYEAWSLTVYDGVDDNAAVLWRQIYVGSDCGSSPCVDTGTVVSTGCDMFVAYRYDNDRNSADMSYFYEAMQMCGNGIVESPEECDDGNTADGDGCSSTCILEYCGDGVIQAGLGEQCDDTNTANGDGCDEDCKTEVCGNGVTQPRLGEECDDGNTHDGDGCSAQCTVEACYSFEDPHPCYGHRGVNLCPAGDCCDQQVEPCVKVMLSMVQEHAPCCPTAPCGGCQCTQQRWCPVCDHELGLNGPVYHTNDPGVTLLEYLTVPAIEHGPTAQIDVTYRSVVPGPETYYSGDEAVVAPPGSTKMNVTVSEWAFSSGNSCSELWLAITLYIPGVGYIDADSDAGTISAPLPCDLLFGAQFAHTAGAGTENPAVKTKMQVQDRFVRVFVKIAHFSGSEVHYDPVFTVQPM